MGAALRKNGERGRVGGWEVSDGTATRGGERARRSTPESEREGESKETQGDVAARCAYLRAVELEPEASDEAVGGGKLLLQLCTLRLELSVFVLDLHRVLAGGEAQTGEERWRRWREARREGVSRRGGAGGA